MYGGTKVPLAVAAGLGGASSATQASNSHLWMIVTIACVIVAAFALLMATGAGYRLLPARMRRNLGRR
ncbi:MAG: hypothetical protein HOV97_05575 [Nonomuraea sp.]|nr:hypothetical protein [Nonomuraea sp.]